MKSTALLNIFTGRILTIAKQKLCNKAPYIRHKNANACFKKATVVDIWQSALDNGLDFQQPMSRLFTSLRQTGQESPKICQSSFPTLFLLFYR